MADDSSFNVPLAASHYERNFAGSATLRVLNRFFESDKSSQSGFSQVARPGTSIVDLIGAGPTIRELATQDGLFGDDLFVVSGDGLWRYSSAGVKTQVVGAISFNATFPSITFQASPGIERLWLADGDNLMYYEGSSKSQAQLDLTGSGIAAADTVSIGGIYYKWVASGVDAGTPAGTLANPWLVLTGLTDADSLANLGDAIGDTGTPGSQYSTALTAHTTVERRRLKTLPNDVSLIVQAITAGAAGDSIALTETSAALAWHKSDGITVTTTLVDGGLHFLTIVDFPEPDNAMLALSCTTVAGHVVIAAANSQRIYYVFPGEFWVDTFAEVEAEPDYLLGVHTVGDFLWCVGTSTIERWAATGDTSGTTPFAPVQGSALKFGAIPDTTVVINSEIYYADNESHNVRNGLGEILSTPGVSEKIRLRG